VEGKLLRLNEDEVLADCAESEDYAILDDNEAPLSFFDMTRLILPESEVTDNTKEYTSLRHFKVRHSNIKKKEKLVRELMSGEQKAMNMQQMIKRDVVELCFERDLEVFRITSKFKRCLKWMVGKGFLYEQKACPCCDKMMRVANSNTRYKDGLIFKCSRHDGTDVKVSIRDGTIFDGAFLSLMEAIRVIFYYFPRGFNAVQAFKDLKEYGIPNIQYNYVWDMYRRIRHLVHLYY
jgi:hypothetical protein